MHQLKNWQVGRKRGETLVTPPPQSIQYPLTQHPEYLVSGGIDWLEWSAAVEWEEANFKQLFDELNRLKEKCQEESKPELGIQLLGTVPVWVHRTGKSRGGGRGQHFPFRISIKGVQIALGNWQCSPAQYDNLYVQLTGRDCLIHGALELRQQINELIRSLGGTILKETLSRADLCLDVANLDVVILQTLIQDRHFITRLKEVRPQVNLIGNEYTGFTAGKRPQRLIAYDKIKESGRKSDYEYIQSLLHRRYGGIVPLYATRLEIQICREFFKKQGISTPHDLQKHGPTAIRSFMTETFRMTDRVIPHGSKNHSLAELHPLWQDLMDGFAWVFGSPGEKLPPIGPAEINSTQLIKQAVGCIRTVLLKRRIDLNDFQEFLSQVNFEINRTFHSKEQRQEFIKDYQFRQKEQRIWE